MGQLLTSTFCVFFFLRLFITSFTLLCILCLRYKSIFSIIIAYILDSIFFVKGSNLSVYDNSCLFISRRLFVHCCFSCFFHFKYPLHWNIEKVCLVIFEKLQQVNLFCMVVLAGPLVPANHDFIENHIFGSYSVKYFRA